ncbi:energy-coupling factor ABC transporter permease [Alteromonas sp. a30]|uniref:energy-coupling factor ABC transporter permease n=1 Tax=Alteromonas sp. a30 TaxID=2730917 RepID=UPI00227E2E0D
MTMLQGLSLVLYAGVLVYLLKQKPLWLRLENKGSQHLLFGSAAALFIMWIFRTGIYPGLNVHFLWITACVLLLGFRLSVISASLALVGTTAIGGESWEMLGVNGLLGVFLPITFTYAIYNLTFYRLPKHLFVYIFVSGFFAGAATIAFKMGLLGSYYALEGIHSWQVVVDNYLILIPLLLFPEGMLNGMTMTMLVIYCPLWVYTYQDRYYLDK